MGIGFIATICSFAQILQLQFHIPFFQTAQYARILAFICQHYFRYCFCVSNDNLREAISSHVARLLKEEREKQKLSLKGLARKAGLARQTITFIEQEVQSPSFDTLLRITSALNIDLAKIIARAQKQAEKKTTPKPIVRQ